MVEKVKVKNGQPTLSFISIFDKALGAKNSDEVVPYAILENNLLNTPPQNLEFPPATKVLLESFRDTDLLANHIILSHLPNHDLKKSFIDLKRPYYNETDDLVYRTFMLLCVAHGVIEEGATTEIPIEIIDSKDD